MRGAAAVVTVRCSRGRPGCRPGKFVGVLPGEAVGARGPWKPRQLQLPPVPPGGTGCAAGPSRTAAKTDGDVTTRDPGLGE